MFAFINTIHTRILKSYLWYVIFLFLSMPVSVAQQQWQEKIEQAWNYIYNNPQKAIEIGQDIYNNALDDETKISSLIILVNGYTAINKNDIAMDHAITALNIAIYSSNEHFQIRTLGLIGEQFQLYHLNSLSREFLNKAEDLLESSSLPQEAAVLSKGNIYAVKGNSYKDQIDCKYAIENYDKAITAYLSASDSSGTMNNLALVYIEKGNCLLEIADYKAAEENFKNAIQIASKNKLVEYLQFAEIGMAKLETIKKQPEKAVERLKKLQQQTYFFESEILSLQIYELLKKNYREQMDLASFLEIQNKYVESFDLKVKEEQETYKQLLYFIENTSIHTPRKTSSLIVYISIIASILILALFYEILRFKQEIKNK